MSRVESETRRRDRLVAALEVLSPLCTPKDRAALAAEQTPAERSGEASGLPVAAPRVYPASTGVEVEDPEAFLGWVQQVGAWSGQHPLAGARLDAATARAYAACPPPGCRAYPRSAALLVPVPAGHAIAGRTQR